LRVYKDIITHNLIFPHFNKIRLSETDNSTLTKYAQEVINSSLNSLGIEDTKDFTINEKILDYEKNIFKLSKEDEILLNNKINYNGFITLIDNNSPKNLQWLRFLSSHEDIRTLRQKYKFQFPIEKVLLVEGATEETLLPSFSSAAGYDFDEEGIYTLPAGGKNQVVKLFYELSEILKIPIFVLMDKDGTENAEEIKPRLRKFDKIYILKCGEFEDLLPQELVKRTLNDEFRNISIIEKTLDFKMPRVKMLEEIYKNRGMHEFKKVEFAKMVKKNIKDKSDISQETRVIIEELQSM